MLEDETCDKLAKGGKGARGDKRVREGVTPAWFSRTLLAALQPGASGQTALLTTTRRQQRSAADTDAPRVGQWNIRARAYEMHVVFRCAGSTSYTPQSAAGKPAPPKSTREAGSVCLSTSKTACQRSLTLPLVAIGTEQKEHGEGERERGGERGKGGETQGTKGTETRVIR